MMLGEPCYKLSIELPLPEDTTSELADLFSHSLLKAFGLTQSGNQKQIYQLQGSRSNH